MKIIPLALAVLAVIALVAFVARSLAVGGHRLSAINSAGVHHGPITRFAETAFGVPHLVAGKGTTAGKQVVPCAATGVIPLGFAEDEAAVGEAVAIEMSYGRTVLGVASGAIAADVDVYTAAGGKLSATGGAGKYLMGRSATAAAADGDEIEIVPCRPVLQS